MKKLSHIEATTLANWLTYSPQAENADEQAGIADGRQERPGSDVDEHPFRTRIIAAAQADFGAYQDQVERVWERHSQQVAELEQRIGSTSASQVKKVDDDRDQQMAKLERELGPSANKMTNLRAKEAEAKARALMIENELGRPLRIHFRYLYFPIMALLALMEVPINRFAFELYFSETPFISFVIAFGIGVVLMLLAHFGGMWVKRCAGLSTWRDRAGYITGVVLVMALILPTVTLIAMLRQHYIHFVQSQQITFAELLEQNALTDVAQQAIRTELGPEGWMLLFINLLVVGIGTLASVLRHDAHPDFETATRQQERLERRIAKLERRYSDKVSKIDTKHDRKVDSIRRKQADDKDSLKVASDARDNCVTRSLQMRQRVAVQALRRLAAYEAGNQRMRSSPVPATFNSTEVDSIENQLPNIFSRTSDDREVSDGIRTLP
ncbi:MAG: hypothetical protein OXH52_10380 [Gammaproteobacteria bacterium]|nr:hypothetical protein [Gammaproteobacteria bacterium]